MDKLKWFVTVYVLMSSHSEEAAEGAHYLYAHAAGHPRSPVYQNTVPRHIHERRGGPENQPS